MNHFNDFSRFYAIFFGFLFWMAESLCSWWHALFSMPLPINAVRIQPGLLNLQCALVDYFASAVSLRVHRLFVVIPCFCFSCRWFWYLFVVIAARLNFSWNRLSDWQSAMGWLDVLHDLFCVIWLLLCSIYLLFVLKGVCKTVYFWSEGLAKVLLLEGFTGSAWFFSSPEDRRWWPSRHD